MIFKIKLINNSLEMFEYSYTIMALKLYVNNSFILNKLLLLQIILAAKVSLLLGSKKLLMQIACFFCLREFFLKFFCRDKKLRSFLFSQGLSKKF